MSKKYKIFLSHACADKALANRFSAFLECAGSIAHGDIYNTDKTDQQIDNDRNYPQHMLDALKNSEAVIFLISNNFLSRPNCAIELGAALSQSKNNIYLLVPPVTHQNLPGFLAGRQTGGNIDEIETLWNLRDTLSPFINEGEGLQTYWNDQCDKFKDELPSILNEIKQIPRITQEEFDEEKRRADNYEGLFENKKTELTQLQAQYEAVKKAKDADEVRKIEWDSLEDKEKYELLVKQAQEKIGKFDQAMKYLIYSIAYADEERFDPRDYNCEWSAVQENIRNTYIKKGREDGEFILNQDDRSVSAALNSLEELQRFISARFFDEPGASADFLKALTQRLGYEPELSNLQYWEHLF